MNLQNMEYLIEISNCGSISAAAKRLFVTQPYLSKVLRAFSPPIPFNGRGFKFLITWISFLTSAEEIFKPREIVMIFIFGEYGPTFDPQQFIYFQF